MADTGRSEGGVDDPPSELTATATDATVALAWHDNSSTETAFEIERWDGGTSSWQGVGSVGPNGTSMSDTGLNASTEYGYRVRGNVER